METMNTLFDKRHALWVWHFNEKLTNKANPCWFCIWFVYISSANKPIDSIAQANMYTVNNTICYLATLLH